MKRQLEHVLAMAELAHVTIQVLPLEVGAHPGMEGSFVLLRFPDDGRPGHGVRHDGDRRRFPGEGGRVGAL